MTNYPDNMDHSQLDGCICPDCNQGIEQIQAIDTFTRKLSKDFFNGYFEKSTISPSEKAMAEFQEGAENALHDTRYEIAERVANHCGIEA